MEKLVKSHKKQQETIQNLPTPNDSDVEGRFEKIRNLLKKQKTQIDSLLSRISSLELKKPAKKEKELDDSLDSLPKKTTKNKLSALSQPNKRKKSDSTLSTGSNPPAKTGRKESISPLTSIKKNQTKNLQKPFLEKRKEEISLENGEDDDQEAELSISDFNDQDDDL